MSGRVAVAAYRLALRLLPGRVRLRMGDEAVELFAWQLARRSGLERVRFVAGSLADVARQSARARLERSGPGARRPRGGGRLEPWWHDLRSAFRNLVRRPGQALPIALTLGLGIGLAAAMVAVVRGVLLDPLPYPDADRLVVVREQTESGGRLPASWANFTDWRASARTLDGVSAVVGPRNATIRGPGEAVRAPVLFVSADWFRVAGVAPDAGRVLRADENRPGAPPAVVVSHGLWERVLGGTEDLESVTLSLADLLNRVESYTVVGVMPPDFALMGAADVYVPLDRAVPWTVRGNHVVDVVARLAAGVSPEEAARELSDVQARINAAHPGETEAVGVGVTGLRDELVGPVRTPVVLLLVGALLLLATSFMNVSGALLARGVARRRELVVRISLGATRGRLLRHLLFESAVYALAGALVGAAVAKLLLSVLARLAPPSIPRLAEVQAAWPGLVGAGAALGLLGTLLFGVATAALTAHGGAAALSVRGGHTSRGATLAWRGLIVAEVALALMLLTTAAVLGRSLRSIITADTGFDGRDAITAEIDLPLDRYASGAAIAGYYAMALDAVGALPGAEAAGLVSLLPLPGEGSIGGPVTLEGGVDVRATMRYHVASGGWLEAMRIRLVAGRTFSATDRAGAPHVALVNRSMAERLWPGEDALGRRFHVGGMDPYREDWLTVIGVVDEARPWSATAGSWPAYYVHHLQRPALLSYTGADIVLRGRDAAPLAAGLRDALAAIDPGVPFRVRTLSERMAGRTADRRFVLSLLAVFAALALVLTAAGIWSVIGFVASRRTRDMGIRLALGARPAQVLRGLQMEALAPVAVGIALGTVLAGSLTRLVRAHLFGVGAYDPVSLAAVAGTVVATAWLASWIPARQARGVDPLITLRDD